MNNILNKSLKNTIEEIKKNENKQLNITEIYNISLKTSIYEVLSYYKITHNKKLCRCPFHNDRRPSLNIFNNNNEYYSWYCFVCNIGGTVYNFIKLMENNNLYRVAEVLAEINKIDINIFYTDFNIDFIFEDIKNKSIEEKLNKLKEISVSAEYRKLKKEFKLTNLEEQLLQSYFRLYDKTHEGLQNIENLIKQIRKIKQNENNVK